MSVLTLDPEVVAQHAAALMERNTWSRERLLEHRNRRLRAVLRRAVERSSFFHERIGALVERDAPLVDFPILTKRELMTNFDSIVTDPRLKRDLVERHLSGPDPGALLLGIYRAAATGGTSGERGVFVYDEAGWLVVISNVVRFQRMLGVVPGTRSLDIGAPSPIHLSNRFHAELRASRPGSPVLDVTMPLAEVVEALNRYRPEAISTYPSFIRALADEQRAGRLNISPRFFRSGAEALTTEVKALVSDVWNVPVYDGYSLT
jgi:phenylacetate-coenzyme A ligase PaaK-like adenylate-forming protein